MPVFVIRVSSVYSVHRELMNFATAAIEYFSSLLSRGLIFLFSHGHVGGHGHDHVRFLGMRVWGSRISHEMMCLVSLMKTFLASCFSGRNSEISGGSSLWFCSHSLAICSYSFAFFEAKEMASLTFRDRVCAVDRGVCRFLNEDCTSLQVQLLFFVE